MDTIGMLVLCMLLLLVFLIVFSVNCIKSNTQEKEDDKEMGMLNWGYIS